MDGTTFLDALLGHAAQQAQGGPYEVEILVMPDLLYKGACYKHAGFLVIECSDGNRRIFNPDHIVNGRVIVEGGK
jgi:hypothetical protein